MDFLPEVPAHHQVLEGKHGFFVRMDLSSPT